MDYQARITELETQNRQLQSELLRTRLGMVACSTGLEPQYAELIADKIIRERGESEVELLPDM